MIDACGELEIDEPYWIADNMYNLKGWIKASIVPVGMSFVILCIFQYFIRKLDQIAAAVEKID